MQHRKGCFSWGSQPSRAFKSQDVTCSGNPYSVYCWEWELDKEPSWRDAHGFWTLSEDKRICHWFFHVCDLELNPFPQVPDVPVHGMVQSASFLFIRRRSNIILIHEKYDISPSQYDFKSFVLFGREWHPERESRGPIIFASEVYNMDFLKVVNTVLVHS